MDKNSGNGTDEDTNGSSFEFIEKVSDSADSEISSEAEVENPKAEYAKISEKQTECKSKLGDSAFFESESLIRQVAQMKANTYEEQIKKEAALVSAIKEPEEPSQRVVDEFISSKLCRKAESEEDEWIDILGSGDLLKKVVKEGTADSRPQRTDICKIKYECRFGETVIETEESLKIQLGDNEVVQGLDLVIPLMNVGEIAEVKVGPRFGYGTIGLPPLCPKDAVLYYTLELLEAKPEGDIETMSVDLRQKIGNKKKERGNWWFLRDECQFAMHCYKRALNYLDYAVNEDFEHVPKEATDEDVLIEERAKVYNNLSVAQMKSGLLDSALNSVNTVLKLQPNNLKAVFRKGKILMNKNELEEALRCFKKAVEIDPENVLAAKELKRCQATIKEQSLEERKLYKKMLSKPVSSDEPVASHSSNLSVKLMLLIGSFIAVAAGVFYYNYSISDTANVVPS